MAQEGYAVRKPKPIRLRFEGAAQRSCPGNDEIDLGQPRERIDRDVDSLLLLESCEHQCHGAARALRPGRCVRGGLTLEGGQTHRVRDDRDLLRRRAVSLLETVGDMTGDRDVAIDEPREEPVLDIHEIGVWQLQMKLRCRDDCRDAGRRSGEDPVLASEWPVQMRMKDAGAMPSDLGNETRERHGMELPADAASDGSLSTRCLGAVHELLGRVDIMEKDGTPTRAIQPRHEMQDRTLRPAEHRGVAEVNNGANHRVVGAGRDSGDATRTSACAARAPNQ